MTRRPFALVQLLVVGLLLAAPRAASAIPAFARKYGTSCLTCHSIYPRLTPFGEAFRRNGYRFPGVDNDVVKQETVALGQEANKKTFPATVWPATIPNSVPIAFGVNGQAFLYPDKKASVPAANNGAQVVLDDIVEEGHIWAGASLDDKTTLWAEVTFGGGSIDVEHAQILFNDLLGDKHVFNLAVGKGFPTLTTFGSHSSYLGDARLTTVPVTGIYGVSEDPFTLVDNYAGLEATGVVAGYLNYSVGLNSGKNAFGTKVNSENYYGHVGAKLGGLRLDGEGVQGPVDAMKPWAEDALTVDAFAFHSRETFADPGTGDKVGDSSFTVGGAVRGQLGSAELDVSAYSQKHDRGTTDLGSVRADVAAAELSYVVYPWMVPSLRIERIGLKPTGGASVSAVHIMPGVAFLFRPNMKAVLVANIEAANGFPSDAAGNLYAWSGGNAAQGGFVAAPRPTSTATSKQTQFESVGLFLAWAM